MSSAALSAHNSRSAIAIVELHRIESLIRNELWRVNINATILERFGKRLVTRSRNILQRSIAYQLSLIISAAL